MYPDHRLMTQENETIGVIIVDHGSRRAQANLCHEDFVSAWRARSGYQIVEPAHLEFADPTIGASIDACVTAGATKLVILPLFLWPGAHLERDIPALVAQSTARHPGIGYVIGPPLGEHALLVQIVDDHVARSVRHLDRPLHKSLVSPVAVDPRVDATTD
jgi:sirohydrochlorin ferrochelatase